jgi:hypothetical protein
MATPPPAARQRAAVAHLRKLGGDRKAFNLSPQANAALSDLSKRCPDLSYTDIVNAAIVLAGKRHSTAIRNAVAQIITAGVKQP